MLCAGIPAYGVQRANFHQKMKMMNLQYLCIFMYIWWLLKFLGVGFLWKACQTLSPSNPTTFLGLCSPGDYRQSIESPMGVPTFNSTEKALTFIIYDCILRIRSKKVCYLTKVSPSDVELIWHAPSVECAVPVYRLTASKGLSLKNQNCILSLFIFWILNSFSK